MAAHLAGIHQNLIFLDVASHHRDLCHSTGREEPWPDCPVGDSAEILHRGRVGGQADDHQLAEDGGLRPERRVADILGKTRPDHRYFLGDNLSGFVNVCSPVEFDVDDGESRG